MAGHSYILHLPDVALEKIFSFLTYDEIAKNRIVCRKFNEICSKLLSRGFIQLEKRHAIIFKRVKSLLPRRESERRVHPLSRHCDILQAVETRISMLNMTYMKYIESNLLCFIPGKVLDEMRNVLSLVESDQTPPRTHQLLQELRDLSSMAMEHFDEHIFPQLKEQLSRKTGLHSALPSTSKSPRILYAPPSLANEVHKIKKQSKSHKHHITFLTQSTQMLCRKIRKQNYRLKAQSLKTKEQERKIQEQITKIQEQETTLAEIKKHIDEWDQKYKDLTTELVRARDAILSAATTAVSPSKRPASTQPLSPPKFYKPNIKPRIANILPKSYLVNQFDFERKRKSNLLPEIPVKRNKSPESDDKSAEDFNLKVPNLIDFEKNKEGKGGLEESATKYNRRDLGSILSTSFENFLKNPLILGIKPRKRKMLEDIDLK